jgi:3-methyladenine DNA glycosylase AlkC
MNLFTEALTHRIGDDVLHRLRSEQYTASASHIPSVLNELYANIPAKKRISYGRVHTIRVLTQYLYTNLREHAASVFTIAAALFDEQAEYRVNAVALGMLSFSAVDDGYEPVLPYFERAAASEEWDLREMAQMFFRKIIKAYPDDMQRYLLKLVLSENPNTRRFVAEGLRPCIENQWFYKQPEYPLTVLRHLFRESKLYPRTSVGNNLSDLARRLPELVYELVAELVASGDKNSYWIAYRACRNLVKKEPIRVMDLLGVDTYTYKKRVHTRSDYQGN